VQTPSSTSTTADVCVYRGHVADLPPRPGRPRIAIEVHGANLNTILGQAVESGQVRCQLLLPLRAKAGLPRGWAIPLDDDETIVATARVQLEETESVGLAVLVAKRGALPPVTLGDGALDQIASALVDAVLAMEVL